MDHSKLTPAQQREARRRLRRVLGEGSPDEQAKRLLRRAFEQAAKRKARAAARTLAGGIVQLIEDILTSRKKL